MVHKPKHKVHSFRGLLGDGGQDEINLERQNANVAYRIVKFQLIYYDPTADDAENVMCVWREEQSSLAATIDFRDGNLLAAGYLENNATDVYTQPLPTIVFSNNLFSRNIFVTNSAGAASSGVNYHIELEEVPVSASTLMQLKLGVARKLNLEQ